MFCQKNSTKYKNIKKIIIFSRDEFKQYNMEKLFSEKNFNCLRYFQRCKRFIKVREKLKKSIL